MSGRVTFDGTPGTSFHLFEESRKPYDFNQSLTGIQTSTNLNKVFFSQQNVNLLHKLIIKRVSDKSGFRIAKQSDTELQVIMRSIYLQYGKNQDCNIKEQVAELNKLVVREAAPLILSNIKQYLGYLNDVENMPRPMEHPRNMSSAGSKSLRGIL